MTLIEAAKQALEALGLMGADLICEAAHHGKKDRHGIGEPCHIQQRWHKAFDALRTAIEAAEKQEPVTQCMEHGECFGGECIYATPPAAQRQWVGLEREIAIAVLNHCYGHIVISADMIDRTTEVIKAKLKERNHG